MPDPNSMTIDECRDWLAQADGWQRLPDGESGRWHWWKPGTVVSLDHYEHPFPAIIDAAAAALPDGWSVKIVSHKGNTQATAWPSRLDRLPSVNSPYNQTAVFHEADTELLARFRLAVACRMRDMKT